MLGGARNPYGCNEDNDSNDADFAELVSSERAQNLPVCQFDEAKGESNNVAQVKHTTVPSVSLAQLLSRGNVKQQVTKRSLEGVQRKVKEIKCEDCQADSSVFGLECSWRQLLALLAAPCLVRT